MKSVFALVIAALLAGCASTPVPPDQQLQVPPGRQYGFDSSGADATSIMIVARDQGFSGAACNAMVWVDGERAAELGTREVVTLHVKGGRHILAVGYTTSVCGSGPNRREIETVIDAGETRKYRISSAQDGGVIILPGTR